MAGEPGTSVTLFEDHVALHDLAGAPLSVMAKKFPTRPPHPERICWGCDKYCPADALLCGNGTLATEWGLDAKAHTADAATTPEPASGR